MNLKLKEIKKLAGKITLKSGLHVGSGNMEMHIGGTDSPVIKHPHTLEPYIPGSSLKGKVRSLLEMESGLMIYSNGSVLSSKTLQHSDVIGNSTLKAKGEAILTIFGTSGADKNDEMGFGPTRVLFSDCYLNKEWKEEAKKYRWTLSEVKSENSINRIQGTAENPRFIERVPEGTEFDFLLTFKVLSESDEGLFADYVLKGLKLLEMDALGGNGSRGYGRIQFSLLKLNNDDITESFRALDPFK